MRIPSLRTTRLGPAGARYDSPVSFRTQTLGSVTLVSRVSGVWVRPLANIIISPPASRFPHVRSGAVPKIAYQVAGSISRFYVRFAVAYTFFLSHGVLYYNFLSFYDFLIGPIRWW